VNFLFSPSATAKISIDTTTAIIIIFTIIIITIVIITIISSSSNGLVLDILASKNM
jgi:hypothetical protein